MNKNILIVDDDEFASEFISKLLNEEGYNTTIARNGLAALEMLANKNYPVILLDLMMPVMNGRETYAEILKLRPRPMVYIFTGEITKEEEKFFLDSGVYGIIYKPFRLDDIRKKIDRAFDEYEKKRVALYKKNVLIVDDDYFVRRNLKKVLSKRNCIIATARNGKIALKKILKKSYDLILLDIKMDGMDGLDTLRIIREKNILAPVILVSGYLSVEAIEEASKYNIFSYVRKPFDVEDLRQKVARALDL